MILTYFKGINDQKGKIFDGENEPCRWHPKSERYSGTAVALGLWENKEDIIKLQEAFVDEPVVV